MTKTKQKKTDEDTEKLYHSYIGGGVKWDGQSRKQFGSFL